MLQKDNFKKALRLTVPIFFGYISIGIPFGLMVVNSGYPWWIALVMCLTIFSGTGHSEIIALHSNARCCCPPVAAMLTAACCP